MTAASKDGARDTPDRRLEDLKPPLKFNDLVLIEERIAAGAMELGELPEDIQMDYERRRETLRAQAAFTASHFKRLYGDHIASMLREWSEWPDVDVDEVDEAIGQAWDYYAELLKEDAAHWGVLESHERWLERQISRAKEAAEDVADEELRRRMRRYTVAYGMRLMILRRFMNVHMMTNTIPNWEAEQAAVGGEARRLKTRHRDNENWIKAEYHRLDSEMQGATQTELLRAVRDEYNKHFENEYVPMRGTATIRRCLGWID